MVQLGFFFYAVDNFLVDIPLKIVFATIYMMFYSIIISILKDIPDFVGDKDQKIKTLTVLIGPSKAFELCTCFLITLYLSGTLSCMFCSNLMRGILVFSLHTLSAILIWRKSGDVNFKSSSSLHNFYMFMWKLFYCEYVFFLLLYWNTEWAAVEKSIPVVRTRRTTYVRWIIEIYF